MDNRKKAMTQVMWILIGVLMLGFIAILFWVLFISGFTDNKDPYEQNPKDMLNDAKYEAVCFAECAKAGTYELEKCTYVPTDFNGDEIDSTCGEIFTRIKESEEDYITEDGVVSGKKSFKLTGDFNPCSKMKITFHEDIGSLSDFAVKIAEKGSPGKYVIPEDPVWQDSSDSANAGFYWLCGDVCPGTPCDTTDADGRIVIDIVLPCQTPSRVKNFKPGVDYEISFKSADAVGDDAKLKLSRTYTKKWSCLKWANFPEGIKFNQKSTKPDFSDRQRTKVEFDHEIKKGTQMFANIKLIKGCTYDSGKGYDCPNDLSLEYDNTEDPENPYYYFRIQPVAESLEEIRFNIKLGGVEICTASKRAEATCQGSHPYLCYKDSDNKQYILHDGPRKKDVAGAIHTRDGMCYYGKKDECETGCVEINRKIIVPKSTCLPPDYIPRTKCLNDRSPSGCMKPDISISKPALCLCNTDGTCTCDDSIKLIDLESSITANYVIKGTIKNIGNEDNLYFHQKNLKLTVEGGLPATKKVFRQDGTTLMTNAADDYIIIKHGEKINFEYSVERLTYSGNNKFKEGTYGITAQIDNIDTALMPFMNAGLREINNKATNTVKIYNKCCDDCGNCDKTEDKCTKLCPGMCRLGTAEVGGGEICKKI